MKIPETIDLIIVEECLALATKPNKSNQEFNIATYCCICKNIYDSKTKEPLPMTETQKYLLGEMIEDRKYLYSHGYCGQCQKEIRIK
jgi:hypothetical protein